MLSSGKSQASEEACGPQEDSSSNIWYNPIPEEEDGPRHEEEIWRRRDEGKEGGAAWREGPGEHGGVSAEGRSSECPVEGANPSVVHHIDDITTEHTGKSASTCLLLLSCN